ncbi:MAG: hypothetical protein V7739_15470 [Motiliproteus sp.]
MAINSIKLLADRKLNRTMSQTLSLSTIGNQKILNADLDEANRQIQELEQKLATQIKANQDVTEKHTLDYARTARTLNDEISLLKAELESHQQRRQIESLEALIGNDSEKQKLANDTKAKSKEIGDLKRELKTLQSFDPERQKKNIASLKTKSAEQASLIKELNSKLKGSAKELSELKAEYKQTQDDSLFVSKDKEWELMLSKFTFQGEDSSTVTRIQALDRTTGASYVAVDMDADDVVWSNTRAIPEEVSIAAGARIKKNELATTPQTDELG